MKNIGKWVHATRCKICGNVYEKYYTPEICKCGVILKEENKPLLFIGRQEDRLTSDCENVIAKKHLFRGWEVKEEKR